ncbi:cytochrome c1 [Luteimonas huabeiensis]|uniref:cytochrome c1 n=1 Tax=Luteimonas huabeiensis TaxID=1244513 RepID=UPI0012687FF1|nr:cytochrome c1 [Luteimonas huabeiensis]
MTEHAAFGNLEAGIVKKGYLRLARRAAAALGGLLLTCSALAAGPGSALQQSGADIADRASLQRGAQLFMNYCSGCHSLKYLRYSRLADDLGLSEDEVMQNLNFTGAGFGEHIVSAMPAVHAEGWFGKPPPDLSLTVRTKIGGPDWVYTFLKSFYQDEDATLGWNNTLYPNVSMPNPLWELQGLQRPVYGEPDEIGEPTVESLQIAQPGRLSAEEFDRSARDIAAFLQYAAEPAALKRQGLGVWVILFLAFFTFLAWLLKKEYWRDVH